MRKILSFTFIFLTLLSEFSESSLLYCQQPQPPRSPPVVKPAPENLPIINPEAVSPPSGNPPPVTNGICQNCCLPAADCVCYYAMPGCYPSAPVCGTACGVSYLSMAIAIGLVVGAAALILSTPFHAHSATPRS